MDTTILDKIPMTTSNTQTAISSKADELEKSVEKLNERIDSTNDRLVKRIADSENRSTNKIYKVKDEVKLVNTHTDLIKKELFRIRNIVYVLCATSIALLILILRLWFMR